jgi:citrate synthase
MINKRLTSAEAAARLGIKPATLYSYVSRGLLQRERSSQGSTFDPLEVARLARSARHPAGPAADGGVDQPIFITELTLIDDGHLYYRGLDAVALSRDRRFEEVAGWLWTGSWPDPDQAWTAPERMVTAVRAALSQVVGALTPVERMAVAVIAASVVDDLRHDLNPTGVPITGRALLSALIGCLPDRQSQSEPGAPDTAGRLSISERLWSRLSALPITSGRRDVLEAALVLSADHELAPSTLAARVAASFRADAYAVVMTGLGPASGGWPSGSSGAPSEVEVLLEEAARFGPEAAIGARLRRTGEMPHGFGMLLYPSGDPRGRELLRRLGELDARPDRLDVVRGVLEVARSRDFPPPNIDLGLGAISFCAEMVPGAGQAITTFAKAAGWLAHAIEEYRSPTRFRSRADYVGIRPDPSPPDGSDGLEPSESGTSARSSAGAPVTSSSRSDPEGSSG